MGWGMGAVKRLLERFWEKVDIDDSDGGCWLWTSGVDRYGYGHFWYGGKAVRAHQAAYELLIGPIPAGLQVDHRHTCPKCCVNPDHLRVVLHKQNGENRDGPNSNSASGFRGVSFHKQHKKWAARATHLGRTIFGGYFDTAEEANEAAVSLRQTLFTHSDMDTPRKEVSNGDVPGL